MTPEPTIGDARSFTELSRLKMTPVHGRGDYVLLDDYLVGIGSEQYQVPAGFRFDGASIPRWFFTILGGGRTNPDFVAAAVLHDWWYHSGTLSRSDADWLFWLVLLWVVHTHGQRGKKRFRARLMYLAVHWFGWLVWCRHPGRCWEFDGAKTPRPGLVAEVERMRERVSQLQPCGGFTSR